MASREDRRREAISKVAKVLREENQRTGGRETTQAEAEKRVRRAVVLPEKRGTIR